MVRRRSASSIASIGFGLTALTIADARGATHTAAFNALTTLNFLYSTAASVNGFFYHFLNPTTGARSPGSELSSVDTAELMAGVLSARAILGRNGAPANRDQSLQSRQLALDAAARWRFYGAWTPESGFQGGYGDFSEAVVLYLLGLGSPTHPSTRVVAELVRTPGRVITAAYHFVTAGDAALFTVQYPQAWFDLRGLADSRD